MRLLEPGLLLLQSAFRSGPIQSLGVHSDTACLRSAAIVDISQSLSLFAHLVDAHSFNEMDRVFTPSMQLSLPEEGFRNVSGLRAFEDALRNYAVWPMQHAIMQPLVDLHGEGHTAHARSFVVATIFDGYDPEKAKPEEIEYGWYDGPLPI